MQMQKQQRLPAEKLQSAMMIGGGLRSERGLILIFDFDFDFDFGMYPSNPPLRLRSLWQLSNLHAKTDDQLYYCIYLLVGLVNRKSIIWTFLLTYPSLFTSIFHHHITGSKIK